ncbi:TonB-dependent siderophore receptor [uncultured Bacteroides sp.]|uniref:TonB-dependent receptor plug domain-containing protein n=1 Tax=uncultured Bacteroides sp. TaxID=162156 RepID=UPI002616D972|nr:TonB-dependent receptor [uncultured Bacteroides sp.]
MVKKMQLLLTVFFLMIAVTVSAQVTTSGMSGIVQADGEPIIGATIQAVHEPSGTNYGTITNIDGRFNLQGMRNGGPYKVTISYVGYQTAVYKDITLQLGEVYDLNVTLKESSELLDEVVVVASASKFSNEKTGATTNISQAQMKTIPTVNRSIEDLARISPYASGMSFAGGDGRSTNFTVDGANFNNNFGLSDGLPGGGNPISMDAIDEIQVVIAPYDVRQTNFIGGGINAVTKSGTNTFKGTAYTYQYNEHMRGNKIDGESLGEREQDAKHIYGATFGGPIIKNKLFFFANVEYEKVPTTLVSWRANDKGPGQGDPDNYISNAYSQDLQRVSDFLREKYGYNTGSYTNFPADESNLKLLGRIDWNITDAHKLSVRYNYTKNTAWNPVNGNSSDTGYRLRNMNRISQYSMSYANSCYSMDNKVSSVSVDLNSRFTDKISNQLLFTFSNIQDIRDTDSSPFPFIDIMAGLDSEGDQILQPYISAGYELFTYNNAVNNKIYTLTDNFTYYAANHKITAGFSFEHQMANNSYMRNGTGYYRYRSIDEFLNGAAPEAFALSYGYNGEKNPNSEVAFNQLGFYAQDDWNIGKRFKLSYGLRIDNIHFDNSSLMRNNAIYELDFGGRHIDTGSWPDSKWQVSPRIGFIWDVFGDKTLKVRGGTGIFTGRLPLVFFTNMPTNSGMIQNLVRISTTYKDGKVVNRDPRLDLLKGDLITNVDEMIKKLGLPATIKPEDGVVPSSIAGVDKDFKMPQIWKTSIAVDYQLPVSFPLTVTGEFMYTRNINAVRLDNYNIKPSTGWERFNGADNRLIYPADYTYYPSSQVSDACVLTNTSRGHGWTGNITVNAQPIKDLNLMFAYTHTESKEVSGMPGSNASSAWSGLYTVNGPNFADVQRSAYVVPDRIIASISYDKSYLNNNMATHVSLFYQGYSPYGNSFVYTNDMNGDGIKNDLIYIPKDDSEIKFTNEQDRADFWAFVNQDSYLKNHKGEYAEAYAARAPWVHRFDLRIAQDFSIKIGKTTNTLQVSLDFLNIGNLLNSKWGVTKTNKVCNNGAILTYEGMDANKVPTFSMYRDKNGNAPTETYSLNKNYTECWKFQVGVRYIFN